MKENKVEVYKDSNGILYEKREDYLIAELDIMHKSQIETWEFFLERVKNNPTEHFKILAMLASKMENQTTEERNKELKEHIEFVKEAQRAKIKKECSTDLSTSQDNWNKTPGSWLGISAQDLGIPNC